MSPRPGDDPEFFRRAPPAGQSRESRIRLDADGRFWHEDALVDRPALQAALHRWLARHPDDGRYILANGYDWCYLTVDDAPCFVTALWAAGPVLWLRLADGSEEPLDPATLREGPGGALHTRVTRGAAGPPWDARLSRAAQAALLPFVVEGEDGAAWLVVGERRHRLPG